MTCPHTTTLGVYLLGALEPAERSTFESHLSYCDTCRVELVRLAPLPGLLNQITPADFADDMPSTGVEGIQRSALATHAHPVTEPVSFPVQGPLPPEAGDPPGNRPGNDRPRTGPPPRRYWRVAAAAATVVVLAVGAIFGWQAVRHETVPTQAQGVVWTGVSSDGEVRVEARMIDHEWGTEIQSKIHGLPPGKKCYYMVWDHYGYREQGGWWGTDHDPNAEIPSATSIMRSKIERIELKLDRETIVLTIWPPG